MRKFGILEPEEEEDLDKNERKEYDKGRDDGETWYLGAWMKEFITPGSGEEGDLDEKKRIRHSNFNKERDKKYKKKRSALRLLSEE